MLRVNSSITRLFTSGVCTNHDTEPSNWVRSLACAASGHVEAPPINETQGYMASHHRNECDADFWIGSKCDFACSSRRVRSSTNVGHWTLQFARQF